MIRRFLWLYLVVIVPTTLSFLAIVWSLDNVVMHAVFEESVRRLDRERLGKIISVLEKTPKEQWSKRLGEVAEVYPYPIVFSSPEQLRWRLDDTERDRLDQGQVALHWVTPDQLDVAQRIPGSERLLVMSSPIVGRTQWWVYAMIVLLPSLVAAVVLFVWFRPFWGDVKEITAVADDIGHGNFDVKAHMSRHSTLGGVGDAINRMADEIRQLLRNASELSLAVAHDLKTPITQLSLAVAILKEERDPSVRRQADGMSRDLAELDASVSEILSTAQLERTAPFFPERLGLKAFLDETIDAARLENAALESARTEVVVGPTTPGLAYFDPRQMRRAVLNLVRNALRHASSVVRVSGSIDASAAYIVVEDDGPGIPAEQRQRMFEAFARGETPRPSGSGASAKYPARYGLGLAIVQRIARLHGGTAEIEDAAGGGARVVIRW